MKQTKCKGGWKDLEVYFCDSAEKPTIFRVYESMYETMKDAFYGSTQIPVFIIGYHIVDNDTPEQCICSQKSFINMRNVTHIKVVGGSTDSDG
jgi:hypothetical protein